MKHIMKMAGVFGILTASSLISLAEVKTIFEHVQNDASSRHFNFKNIPHPAINDAAAKARFLIVDGSRDGNSGGIEKLHDGKVPGEEDQPGENFFFNAGTDGGRILIDLASAVDVRQVNTFSWHGGDRGPQVYKLYASKGDSEGFNPEPKRGTNPETCGWKWIANIDTRDKEGENGGQHGVSITDSDGLIGSFRYLLLDVSRTALSDRFSNTFLSEIDVLDATTPEFVSAESKVEGRKVVEAGGGIYQITIDTSEASDLNDWVDQELILVIQEWYPKIVALLPSEGFEAPKRFSILFSKEMRGVAAASGTRIRCSAEWIRNNLKGEAKGAIVHEMVHVVQQYGRARRNNPDATRTPGWLVEGIPDYIRWFLYETDSKGAEITQRNFERARYDASYRISANFLNWVIGNYDKEIIRKLNAAARDGKYSPEIWKETTGKSVEELGEGWKKSIEAKLSLKKDGNGAASKE